MKIAKVTLKDMSIKEVNGEFEQIYDNEQNYPCFITNYAMKRGKDMGLVKSSLATDLIKLNSVMSGKSQNKELEIMNNLDEESMQKVIYLGVIGANSNLDLDFESFLQKYHSNFTETVELYLALVTNFISNDPNAFAKALEKNTKKEKKM